MSTDSRFTECPICDGEGRILRQGTNVWDVIDRGECPTCLGSGVAEIEVEPLTLEDLE